MSHASTRLPPFASAGLDPVLGSLTALARRHHRLVDEDILAGGLPLDAQGRLPSEHIVTAAARAGFTAERVGMGLSQLTEAHLPAMLLLADGDACVLTARRPDGSCEVLLGEATASVLVPWGTLAARHTGQTVLLTPRDIATDDDALPSAAAAGARRHVWRRRLPLAVAALPGDAVALALAAFVPLLARHWHGAASTVAVAAALAVMADGMLRLSRRALLERAGRPFDAALSAKLFRQILGQGQTGSTGAFAEALRAFEGEHRRLARTGVAVTAEIPFILVMLGALVWLSGPLAAVPALVAVLLPALGLALRNASERAAHTLARDAAHRHGLLVESLSAAETLRALGAEMRMARSWEQRTVVADRALVSARRLEAVLSAVPAAVHGTLLVGLASWGAGQVVSAALSPAYLAVSLLLAGRVAGWAGDAMGLLARGNSAAEAVRGLKTVTPRAEVRAEPSLLDREELRMATLREATYHYPDRTDAAVSGVSLTIRPGDRLALTGGPAAGKTTVARLLLGLVRPDLGEVEVNGRAPASDAATMRRVMGYCPQDPVLISGRLRDNLTLCAPGAGEADILEAVNQVGLSELVAAIGLDGFVGERGERLSLGQRQGVTLARALLGGAPLLVLDEPCSSWDDLSLERLAERLKGALAHRSLLLISQRQPLLALADQRLVLSAGRLA